MKKYDSVEITVGGKALSVTYIGKGAFTRAYSHGGRVLCQTTGDISKELLLKARAVSNSRVLPDIRLVYDEGNVRWYEMPLYHPVVNGSTRELFEELKSIVSEVRGQYEQERRANGSDGHFWSDWDGELARRTVEAIDRSTLPDDIKSAFNSIYAAAEKMDMVSELVFEVVDRNVGILDTRPDSQLVLYDIVAVKGNLMECNQRGILPIKENPMYESFYREVKRINAERAAKDKPALSITIPSVFSDDAPSVMEEQP